MTTTQQQPKVQMMGIKIKAKINLTADDWQLYSAMSVRDPAPAGAGRRQIHLKVPTKDQ